MKGKEKMKQTKYAFKFKALAFYFLCIMLLLATTLNLVSCAAFSVSAYDLMEGVSAPQAQGKAVDNRFTNQAATFYVELFKKSFDNDKNSLISPLSVLLALAMTANGADGQTLDEMQACLGGEITLPELNEYLVTYSKSLPSGDKSKLNTANSIWFRDNEDRLTVEKDFLEKNAAYYNAAAYKSPFDDSTLKDINNWVKNNTDNMIDKILDAIDGDTVMYLINAVVFDAEWKTVYNKNDISSGLFTDIKGEKQSARFMFSEENIYLEDSNATGFIKPYANGAYSFAALLPNEGISIKDYIATLTGESFLSMIKSAKETKVSASLPKFSYDYTLKMNDILKELGINKAFSASDADFTKLGRSTRGNIFIGEVLHKTFIAVDELGTRAGAVTKVEMKDEAYCETKEVKLDRPFVYAIIDNATGLPVFIGAMVSLQK